MIVGFTGTRMGMTEEQKAAFTRVIPPFTKEFHHGMCEGSDTEAHNIIRTTLTGTKIVGHPSRDKTHEVDSICCELLPPMGHLARNRAIVDSVDYMYATPPSMEELPRGGTWYTIRYAVKRQKPCFIIFPDGSWEVR